MMPRAFRSDPFIGIDGSVLVTNNGSRIATERDMEWFWRTAEPELDRLTMELCTYHRSRGEPLDQWQLDAELAAFKRTRVRTVASESESY